MLSHCHSLGEGRGRVTESSPCAVTGPKLSLALRGSSPRSPGSQCWFRQGPPHERWRGECTPARCPRVFLNKRFLTTPCTCRRDNSCASDGSSLHQVRLQLPPFRIQSSQQMEADPRAPSMHRCGGRLGRSRLSAAQEGPHFQLSKGDTSFARALLPQSWFPLHRREVIWCFPSWGGSNGWRGWDTVSSALFPATNFKDLLQVCAGERKEGGSHCHRGTGQLSK